MVTFRSAPLLLPASAEAGGSRMADTARKARMSDKLSDLDLVLDEESWDWLFDNHPKIATSVKNAVGSGATPADIRGVFWSALVHIDANLQRAVNRQRAT